MESNGFVVASIAEETGAEGWAPLRHKLGITGFGLNAWTRAAGEQLVGAHDESESGQQEVYLLLSGAASFTIGDATVELEAGQLTFVHDPALTRGAVAQVDGTTVLAIGTTPGVVYEPRGWDEMSLAMPYFHRGEYEEARRLLAGSFERHPNEAVIAYNLACTEVHLGLRGAALAHLQVAFSDAPRLIKEAREDPDLAALAEDPRFIALLAKPQ